MDASSWSSKVSNFGVGLSNLDISVELSSFSGNGGSRSIVGVSISAAGARGRFLDPVLLPMAVKSHSLVISGMGIIGGKFFRLTAVVVVVGDADIC